MSVNQGFLARSGFFGIRRLSVSFGLGGLGSTIIEDDVEVEGEEVDGRRGSRVFARTKNAPKAHVVRSPAKKKG